MSSVRNLGGTFLLLGVLFAQEGTKFGVRLAPALGFFRVDSGGRTPKALSGAGAFSFGGGLMLSFGFSDNVSLLLGAGVNTVGGNLSFKEGYGIKGKIAANNADTVIRLNAQAIGDAKYRATTVNVPVFIKMRTNLLGSTPIRAKAMLGGNVDVRVGSSIRASKAILSADFIDQERMTGKVAADHILPFFAYAGAGAGVDVELEGVGTIDFTIIYNHGLTNVINKDFKFNFKDSANREYKDLKPYQDLRARASNLQFQLIFWFGS
ncbi:MAG: hypothetical protein RMK98_05265 [Bacteroidia bacterium]|nr:hypothetical protein [Bacteroidia bacterium]